MWAAASGSHQSRRDPQRARQRGYATRRRDPEDRRRHLVEVSNKGIAVIEKVSEVMDGVQDDLLDGLEPVEREQLEGLLTSIWAVTLDERIAVRICAVDTGPPS